MRDQDWTREELLEELHSLRGRVARLEAARDGRPGAGDALPPMPAWAGRVLETIDDAFFVLDREWRFRYVNRPALQHAGVPPDELLGRSLWETYPALRGTPLEMHYRRAMAEQVPAHFEMEGLLTGRWLEVHAYPSPDALIVYSRDATERKRAEQALLESEQRFRQMAEAIDEVFWMKEADADRLLYISPAYETVWGRTCQSLYDRPRSWLEAVHPDDRERVVAQCRRLVERGDLHVEYRIVRPDGSVRWVQDSGFHVRDENGRVYRFVGAAKDVTDRKQAEADLRDYVRRLQQLSRRLLEVQEEERRRLAIELHDEVAQVLVGLHYNLEIGLRSAGAARDATLTKAQALVKDLAQRVRDTSLLLRPSMLDDFGLEAALRWHCERYRERTGVRVELELADLAGRLPAEVETTAYRVVQEALTNVARHAGVSTAAVRLWRDGAALWLEVEDRGAGFDPAAVRSGAAGSGLSGMAERVALLGGRLSVDSAPAAGTRLRADLPTEVLREDGPADVDPPAGR